MIGDFDKWQTLSITMLFKIYKNNFQVVFYRKENHIHNKSFFDKISELALVWSIAPSHPNIFGIQTPGAVARLVAYPLCMQTVQI